MSDLNEILENLKKQLSGLEETVKGKFEGVDKTIEEQISVCSAKLKDLSKRFKNDDITGSNEKEDDENTNKARHRWRWSTGFGAQDDDEKSTEKHEETSGESDEFAEKIEKIAPYLDEDTLYDAVKQFVDGDIDINISSILPYLGDDSISLLMKKLTVCGGEFNGLKIEDILPYAESDAINEAFMAKARQGIIDEEMMPYIDDDCWHELVVEYCKNADSKLNIDQAYPYLDDEDVALLFKTYLKRRKKNKS